MNNRINDFTDLLAEKDLTLSLAESITCGLASHQLSTAPGTSDVFRGSVVCYSSEVKRSLFGVSKKMLRKHTAESPQVTRKLAKNLSKVIPADIQAAITGLASADGSESKKKPVGTVFFCIVLKRKTINERHVFRGTPLQVRKKAVKMLFDLIEKEIRGRQ
jgi:nicotinamide-nucleotide amidase